MPTPNYLLRSSETEREANFEVYTNGERTLNQAVGIRVQGNTSRQESAQAVFYLFPTNV